MEPSLRAGAPFLTESFLPPFRFNLGQSLVRSPGLPGSNCSGPIRSSLSAPRLSAASRSRSSRPRRRSPRSTQTTSGTHPPDHTARARTRARHRPQCPRLGRGARPPLRRTRRSRRRVGRERQVGVAVADALVAAGGQLIEGLGPCRLLSRATGSASAGCSSGCVRRDPRDARSWKRVASTTRTRSVPASIGSGGRRRTPRWFRRRQRAPRPAGTLDERLGSFVWQGSSRPTRRSHALPTRHPCLTCSVLPTATSSSTALASRRNRRAGGRGALGAGNHTARSDRR